MVNSVVGRHVLADCRNVNKSICLDDKRMLEVMAEAATVCGANVISQVRYHFGHNSPPGFACLVMLDESHLSAHCYADDGLIAMDVFTCGKTDPEEVFKYISEKLGIIDYTVKVVDRF